jgi:tetratricopeptide (TPR) repeat protein
MHTSIKHVLIGVLVTLILVACGVPSEQVSVAPPTALPSATSLPTAQPARPTAAPALPTNTPEPSRNVPGLIRDALTKTRALKTYRVEFSLSDFDVPTDETPLQELRHANFNAAFDGSDVQYTFRGPLLMPIGLDRYDELEIIAIGDDTFAHGPLSLIGATEKEWYELGTQPPAALRPPLDAGTILDALVSLVDLSAFAGAGQEAIDGQNCATYRADQVAALLALNGFGVRISDPVKSAAQRSEEIDFQQVEFTLWICDDGYLHQLKIDLAGAPKAEPAHGFMSGAEVRFFDLNGPITITAPADARPLAAAPSLTATVYNGGNLREQPELTGRVLDQINAGETVQLLAKTSEGAWYQITNVRAITGWVSQTLLTIDPAVASQVPDVSQVADAPAAAPTPGSDEMSPEALVTRGLRRERGQDLDGGLADYNAALQLDPQYADAYYFRSALRAKMGDQKGGLEDYQHAKQLDPDPAKAAYHWGRFSLGLGDLQASIDSLTEAIRLNPKYDQAYYTRGVARTDMGDPQGAIEDFTEALKLNPNFASAAYNRALQRSRLNDFEGAIDDYTLAISIEPDFAYAYTNRAWVYDRLGRYDEAIEDYSAAIRIRPNSARTYCDRGSSRIHVGDYQGAIEDTTTALKIDPNYYCAYLTRARAHYYAGDYQGAIKDYTSYIEFAPRDTKGYTGRGASRDKSGDHLGAIKDYDKAIELDPQEPLAYNNRGQSYLNIGNRQAAIADWKKAAELYRQQGKQQDYERLMAAIKQLEEQS